MQNPQVDSWRCAWHHLHCENTGMGSGFSPCKRACPQSPLLLLGPDPPQLRGHLPASWYPGTVLTKLQVCICPGGTLAGLWGCREWLRFEPHLWGRLLSGASVLTELLAAEPSSLALATTLPCPPFHSGALRADLGSVLHAPPGEALATLQALSRELSPHGQAASSP